MSGNQRRYFSGSTIAQALTLAARHHKLAPEAINYRQIERRHGFIKNPKRVVIEVDPESPRRVAAAVPTKSAAVVPGAGVQAAAAPPAPITAPARPERPSSPPRERREPRPRVPRLRESSPPVRREEGPPLDDAVLLIRARQAMGQILGLSGLDLKADVRCSGGVVEANLSGPGRALLVAEEGELLEAVEALLPRAIPGAGEGLVCRVDSDGFRQEREDALRALARETAAAVKSSGRPVRLEAMGPGERRIVHMTLQEDPTVSTESEGEGFFKRVWISPA